MKTGYVHYLIDNKLDFEAFALTCTRAFGALSHLRNEPLGAPLTEPTVSNHYAENAKGIEARIAELEGLGPDDRAARGRALREETLAQLERSRQDVEADNAILRATLYRAEAWAPPTPEHEKFKEFMCEQLESSMNDENWYADLLTAVRLKDALGYFQAALDEAREDLVYYVQQQRAEEERVAQNVEWLRQLRTSLGR